MMIVEQETVDEQKGGPVGGMDVDKEREGTKSMPVFLVGVGVVEGRQYKDQHWDLCRALTSQSYIEVFYITYLANAEYYLYHCCRKGRQAFNL